MVLYYESPGGATFVISYGYGMAYANAVARYRLR